MAEPAEAEAPKPGEVRVDIAALSGDVAEAGEALTGLFEDSEIPASGETPEQEAGRVETPATGDTEDGQSEQAETPAIEPPATWTAEEKQQFLELPPEAQTALAPVLRRESERERLISTQVQKTAEEAQRLATIRQTVETERAQQAQFLQGIVLQLMPELQAFQNTDWRALSRDKPAEYVSKWQDFQDVQGRINTAQAHMTVIQQQRETQAATQRQETLVKEQQMLLRAIPDFADPVKGKALAVEMQKFLPEIRAEEWGGFTDHRVLAIARDAMLYRKGVQARAAAQKQRVPAAPPNVRPLRPAARQPGAGEEANQKQVAALHDNLRKTGSYRDAAAVLAATGIFGKN